MGAVLSDLNISSDEELDNYPINNIRGLKWRYHLGLFDNNNNNKNDTKCQVSNITLWINKLNEQIIRYNKLKDEKMPDINKVSDDPLLGFGSSSSSSESDNNNGIDNDNDKNENENESGTWKSYYKDVELIKFIKGDLDRLYLDGVPDDYFQDEIRKTKILNVLFIWSCLHYDIGAYRQGMHELVGTIVHVLESEENYFKKLLNQDKNQNQGEDKGKSNRLKLINMINNNNNNNNNNKSSNIEAYAFAIFERVMVDMQDVYNPHNSKFVVNFCDDIQGQKLELYDPHLASIMTNTGIPSHVYGLRWTRLLMGREFAFTQVLELWDYIFKCIYQCTTTTTTTTTTTNDSNSIKENILDISERIMIAMLIRLRGVLAINDMSESLAVLMKFPPLDNEDFRHSIIKVAERIKMRKINVNNNNNSNINNNNSSSNSVFSLGSIPSYDDMDNDKSSGNNNTGSNSKSNGNVNRNSNGYGDSDDEALVKDDDRNRNRNSNINNSSSNNNEGLKYSVSTEDMEKAKQQQQQQQQQAQSSRFGIPNLPTLPQMNIPNLIPSMANIQRPKWMKSSNNNNNGSIVTLNEISKRLSLITNESVTLPDKDKVHLEALIQVINNKLSLKDYDIKFGNDNISNSISNSTNGN